MRVYEADENNEFQLSRGIGPETADTLHNILISRPAERKIYILSSHAMILSQCPRVHNSELMGDVVSTNRTSQEEICLILSGKEALQHLLSIKLSDNFIKRIKEIHVISIYQYDTSTPWVNFLPLTKAQLQQPNNSIKLFMNFMTNSPLLYQYNTQLHNIIKLSKMFPRIDIYLHNPGRYFSELEMLMLASETGKYVHYPEKMKSLSFMYANLGPGLIDTVYLLPPSEYWKLFSKPKGLSNSEFSFHKNIVPITDIGPTILSFLRPAEIRNLGIINPNQESCNLILSAIEKQLGGYNRQIDPLLLETAAKKSAATNIQSVFRGAAARVKYKKKQIAAVKVKFIVRNFLKRRRAAATNIQSVFRGAAATNIQSVFRGAAARVKYKKKQIAAVKVKFIVRNFLKRRRAAAKNKRNTRIIYFSKVATSIVIIAAPTVVSTLFGASWGGAGIISLDSADLIGGTISFGILAVAMIIFSKILLGKTPLCLRQTQYLISERGHDGNTELSEKTYLSRSMDIFTDANVTKGT